MTSGPYIARKPANPADEALAEAMVQEEKYIAERLRAAAVKVGEPAKPDSRSIRTGLALSGGGIRSATFSLGILQALSRAGLISRFDYLSTVSGGSYIGSFFGALYVPPEKRGGTPMDAAEEAGLAKRPLQSPRGRKAVANLREFGRYLTPGGASDTMYGISSVARNWVTLQIVLGFLPLFFFLTVRLLQTPKAIRDIVSTLESLVGWFASQDRIGSREFRSTTGAMLDTLSNQSFSGVFMLLTLSAAMLVCSAALAYWYSRRESVPERLEERFLGNYPLILATLTPFAVLYFWPELANPARALFTFTCLVGDNIDQCRGTFYMPLAVASVSAWSSLLYFGALASERIAQSKSVARRRLSAADEEENVRGRLTRWLASLLLVTLLLGAATLIDYLGDQLANATREFDRNTDAVLTSWGRAETYGGLLLAMRFFWPFLAVSAPALLTVWAHNSLRKGMGQGWLSSAAGQGALGVSILFFWMVIWAAVARSLDGNVLIAFWVAVLAAIGIVSFCFGFLNQSSLVSLYAHRLKRAFVGASNPAERNVGFDVGRNGDTIAMQDYYGAPGAPSLALQRPVHLINLTIAQTQPDGASHVVAYDRKGKPMHVSPAGLIYEKGGAGFSERRAFEDAEELSLSTWTAISGAAASTAIGSMTSLGLSILAMMANVRLGYWWKTNRESWWQVRSANDTVLGYLIAELQSNFATDADRQRWYLTDGGHFENTGAYALIQRRLDFIVVCDNGADPDYRLDDVVRLVDRARADLKAEISFLDGKALDRQLGKDSALRAHFGSYAELAKPPPATETERRNQPMPYAALARITYDIDDRGLDPQASNAASPATALMLLIKPRLNFSEPPELLAYERRQAGVGFPQQSTLDQFFDEEQWEAYRRFGEIVGEQLFDQVAGAWTPNTALQSNCRQDGWASASGQPGAKEKADD